MYVTFVIFVFTAPLAYMRYMWCLYVMVVVIGAKSRLGGQLVAVCRLAMIYDLYDVLVLVLLSGACWHLGLRLVDGRRARG
jgi:hypothetical protein